MFLLLCLAAIAVLGIVAALLSRGDDTPVVPAEDCSTCISKADGSCKIACLMEEKKRRESNKTPNDDV